MLLLIFVWFVFFNQETAYEMRISDWSSDVCSSDLGVDAPGIQALARGLRAAGHEVLIVAPDRDRSGASNSLTLDAPVRVVQQEPAVWRVHGTPTDCVH